MYGCDDRRACALHWFHRSPLTDAYAATCTGATHARVRPALGAGICSVYVDESADVPTAVRVAVDSKIDYPVACNAAEKLVVHRGALKKALPAVGEALLAKGVAAG